MKKKNVYVTKSKSRDLANEKMQALKENPFSMLLIGERGVGKSRLAKVNCDKEPFKSANCASFADDLMAEAELFGYEEGAFTGATKEVDGLFQEADKGCLFLDEIHHLSKRVQAKLMLALQTDENNMMSVHKLRGKKGGDGTKNKNEDKKVTFKLIVATNRTIEELRKILLPDFYDRIVQNVIEIPPLRETPEDREDDWKMIWSQMKFAGKIPNEPEFINWLKTLQLYGNFRDLQKIAIYCNDFMTHIDKDEELKEMIGKKTAFEYAKSEFEKWKSPPPEQPEDGIDIKIDTHKTAKDFRNEFYFKLYEWAVGKYGDIEKAAKQLGVSPRNMYNWRDKNDPIRS